MSATEEYRLLDVLDETECRRLLSHAVIGRLAFTEGALPAIQPVHFIVHGGRVLIPTRVGSKVAAASRGAVVAFEVDDFDAGARTGWNVTVVGPAHVITDPADVAELQSLGARPWAPADRPCFIAVEIAVLSGRRITTVAPAGNALAGARGSGAGDRDRCPVALRPETLAGRATAALPSDEELSTT